jgi:hypothetical protein
MVPFQDNLLLSVSKVALTEPAALLSFGGTSLDAFRSAFKSTVLASEGAVHMSETLQARAISWICWLVAMRPPENS